MKRFNRNIGALESTLEKRPEVFNAVRMHVPAHVSLAVVNDRMNVGIIKTFVGRMRVTEYVRAFFDVLAYSRLHCRSHRIRNDHGSDVAAVALKQSHHRNLADEASSGKFVALALVHVAGEPADESFVNFDITGKLAAVVALQSKPHTLKHEPRQLLIK